MKGEWCVFNQRISKFSCENIVKKASLLPKKAATLGVEGVSVDTQMRKSQIAFIEKNMSEWEFLFDLIWKLAIQANDDWFDFHLSKFDYIQFAEYNSAVQGEYKRHHDIFYMNNDPKYHRKLSAVVQLTDPSEYEGGDLELYGISSTVPRDMFRNQGSVIFFPSFVEHAALPVTKGIRHSLAIWVDGPKWR